MAFHVKILADLNLSLLVFCDEVTIRHMLESHHAQRLDPLFETTFNQLVYFDPKCTILVDSTELRTLASELKLYAPSSQRVICTGPDDLTYGLSRMFQMVNDSGYMEVSRTLEQGCETLKLDCQFIRREITNILADNI